MRGTFTCVCKIILKSVYWLDSSGHSYFCFFPIFSSGSQLIQWSGTVLAILVKGHDRMISVKLEDWSFCVFFYFLELLNLLNCCFTSTVNI